MRKLKLKACLVVGLVFACLLIMMACAPHMLPPEETGDNGSNVAAGGAFNWTESSDCAMCHTRSVSSLASSSCEAMQGDPDSTCLNCHTDVAGIKSAHANVSMTDTAGDLDRLKKTNVEESTCLSCHDLDDITLATADVALTDSEGTSVNPHEAMTVHNVNAAHDDMTCSSCHKMHSSAPTLDNAANMCLGCHHEDVYECYTCHS